MAEGKGLQDGLARLELHIRNHSVVMEEHKAFQAELQALLERIERFNGKN